MTFAEIGDALGAERMGEIMTAFRFAERPPIDLPDVAISGRRQGDQVLPNGEEGMDTARLAIGQERLAVTPCRWRRSPARSPTAASPWRRDS